MKSIELNIQFESLVKLIFNRFDIKEERIHNPLIFSDNKCLTYCSELRFNVEYILVDYDLTFLITSKREIILKERKDYCKILVRFVKIEDYFKFIIHEESELTLTFEEIFKHYNKK